jgi:hypothetical protein
MKPMSLLPLTILLVTSGCPFGPVDGPPPPDDCSSPSALDGIDSIEVGALQNGTFVPWQDGQAVELTSGSQGSDMLGVALSLSGSDLPRCMRHTMELAGQDGLALAGSDYSVRTYPGSGDTRTTAMIWMIFEGEDPMPGEQLELVLHVGSLEIRRFLHREGPQPASVRIVNDETFQDSDGTLDVDGQYSLLISFDRPLEWGAAVTIESSDPDVVRPVSPALDFWSSGSNQERAEIEALAPGGPVTLSISGGGNTVEIQVTVLGPILP